MVVMVKTMPIRFAATNKVQDALDDCIAAAGKLKLTNKLQDVISDCLAAGAATEDITTTRDEACDTIEIRVRGVLVAAIGIDYEDLSGNVGVADQGEEVGIGEQWFGAYTPERLRQRVTEVLA